MATASLGFFFDATAAFFRTFSPTAASGARNWAILPPSRDGSPSEIDHATIGGRVPLDLAARSTTQRRPHGPASRHLMAESLAMHGPPSMARK